MKTTSLHEAFPVMPPEEKTARCLRHMAALLLPQLHEALFAPPAAEIHAE